jgi:uncharacterized membrane protein YdjX (TVP38/TMEM64 family)
VAGEQPVDQREIEPGGVASSGLCEVPLDGDLDLHKGAGRRWRRGATFLALVGLAVVGWVFHEPLMEAWSWLRGVDVAQLRATIQGLGPWAPLASMGLMVIHAFVPFPLELLAVANGLVFGTWGGIAITWSSMVVSSWVGYAAARFAGPLVYRLAPGNRLARVQVWAKRRSDWELVAVRFIPIISFSLLNLAMGVLRISFWRFTWTTALGIIPIVVVSVVSGHLLTFGPWAWVALTASLLALVLWKLLK